MVAEPVRLTASTRAVLRAVALSDRAGEQVWAAQVARDRGLDPETAAAVLHRLAARGWVRRSMEAGDPSVLKRPLRAFYGFTPEGRSQYRRLPR